MRRFPRKFAEDPFVLRCRIFPEWIEKPLSMWYNSISRTGFSQKPRRRGGGETRAAILPDYCEKSL